jgi:glycosyltransferase involved in cell wall biosynthesis
MPRGSLYLLYVGGLSPHKNLGALIEAYRRLTTDHRWQTLYLLLVGDYAGDPFYSSYAELRAVVARHGLDRRVIFTGFVPDETLVHLYNRAELLVLPSFEEGFGLPAIEAAACGTPVAASTSGPVGALLGRAAWTFSPHDVAGLAAGLADLLSDRARSRAMGDEGERVAAGFSWERAAGEVHALFQQIADSPRGQALPRVGLG